MRKNKYFKKAVSVILATSLVVAWMPSGTAGAATKGTVQSVKISNAGVDKTLVLKKGKTYKLKVTVKTSGSISKKVKFKSSAKSIVSVSKKGQLKAKANGTATITVTSKGDKKKKTKLNVIVGTPVTKVALSASKKTLTVGKSFTLKATLSPKKVSVDKVKFSTADKSIATVTSNGKVTAKKAGKVKITALAADGSNKKAVCTVTVQDAEASATKAPDVVASAVPSAPASAAPSAPASAVPSAPASAVPSAPASAVPSAPAGVTTSAPESAATKAPESAATKAPEGAATKAPEGAATKAPEGVATKAPEGAATKAPEGAATKAPESAATKKPDASDSDKTGDDSDSGKTGDDSDSGKTGDDSDSGKTGDDSDSGKTGEETGDDETTDGTDDIAGDFSGAGSLTEGGTWQLSHVEGGAATATVADNQVTVKTTKVGNKTYSIQLIQAGFTLENGASYILSFDAKASAARNMQAAIVGPDKGYAAYMNPRTVALTTEKQSFSYIFTMNTATDENARLGFDMGGTFGSTADVVISNVVLKKNLIKNGAFDDEGALEFNKYVATGAEASDPVKISEDGNNYCKMTISKTGSEGDSVQLNQYSIPLEKGKFYRLQFRAKSDKERKIGCVLRKNGDPYTGYLPQLTVGLTGEYKTIKQDFKMEDDTDNIAMLAFFMGAVDGTINEEHNICVDDVSLVEITESEANLLKNAKFENEHQDWTAYVSDAAENNASGSCTLEDGVATYALTSAGDTESAVALVQEGLVLKKGQKYRLTFNASSTVNRTINVVFQDSGYNWFGGNGALALTTTLTKQYIYLEPNTELFGDEDTAVVRLNFALGKKTEWENTVAHTTDTPASTIVISDLLLVEVAE